MRLVLDTVVLVTARRSPRGAAAELLRQALRVNFDLLLSGPLVLEYEAVLKRPEHLLASSDSLLSIDQLLSDLVEVSVRVKLEHFRRPTTPDPGDEHVLNLAWRGRADLLVTHNLRHFEPSATQLGVKCCSPRDALRALEEHHVANARSQ